jgi:hypothetical protein
MPRPIFKPQAKPHVDPKALAWRQSRRGMDALAKAVGIQRRPEDIAKSALDRAQRDVSLLRLPENVTTLKRIKPRVVAGTDAARALGIGR